MTKEEHAHDLYCGSAIDGLRLSVYAFRILFHLKRKSGKDGVIRRSIRSIAEACRIDKERVIEAIRELEQRQLIQCERALKRTTIYQINPPALLAKLYGKTEQILYGKTEQIAPNCTVKPNIKVLLGTPKGTPKADFFRRVLICL